MFTETRSNKDAVLSLYLHNKEREYYKTQKEARTEKFITRKTIKPRRRKISPGQEKRNKDAFLSLST